MKCACGAMYAPKDHYAVKRHETSAKHLTNMKGHTRMTEEAFSDLDDETPAPVEKPKRKRASKRTTSFDDLDKTEAAKSFTEDERLAISTAIAGSSGVHDLAQSAESIAQAFVDAAGNINAEVLDDLRTYVIGVVAVVRANGNGETPEEETPVSEQAVAEPKSRRAKAVAAKAKPAPKAKAEKVAPVAKPVKAAPTKAAKIASGNTKACRVCSVDKPLEEFRKKSSRPDGRDTICAACAKAWDDTHKAAR